MYIYIYPAPTKLFEYICFSIVINNTHFCSKCENDGKISISNLSLTRIISNCD